MQTGAAQHNLFRSAGRLAVNLLYVLGIGVSLVVGGYGVVIMAVTLFPALSLWSYGLIYGLPLVIASLIYLAFTIRLLSVARLRQRRYAPGFWVPAVFGIGVLTLLFYGAMLGLRGL